jgi:formylglycine-generating enzyme required for sulfatase activity
MPKVFISYRRQDSADVTGRLHDRLDAQFGRESVFMDIDSIPFSVDFRKRLNDAVQQTDVLLAVIGDHWLDASFEKGPKIGKRRLEDPNDYVRIEIESALSLGIPVVPILVGRASMPSESDLPGGLKELAYKNAAEARSGPNFHVNVDRLIRGLEDLVTDKQALWESFRRVSDVAAKDPDLGLIGTRKVLQRVVREVYERRIGEPAGTRPLEKIVERLVREHYFPFRFGTGPLFNKDVHIANPATTIAAADAQNSLTQLTEILKWYTEVEQPDGVGQLPARRRERELISTKAVDHLPVPRLAVVPKGLRSFDSKDANFFLELLPGPRNEDGLPESIQCWKDRIEAASKLTFTVGLIYGPSGCGKSSLMKAGLLPRLADRIRSVYVEATAEGTETRLLRGLREQCPELPHDLDLTETFAALRQGQHRGTSRKVFVVLDQFEQWLHAKRQYDNTELVKALRQCDGERVQAIVMVRDDFWLAVSRFLAALEVDLVAGQNIALVDLFDLRHAKKVLTAFGRAFGALLDDLPKDQEEFLDHAVAGLAQDERVISVRLALFADMVKSKPWTPATLKEVGGTEGVGVTFLEETFSAPSANPNHRLHQKAARAVLRALLPEQGTDIKGNMRSRQELMEASGYGDRPKDFDELIRILDSEVRLITPTDPEGVDPDAANTRIETSQKYYQLTHDYLVPSLRDWLTRKQRETGQGRAELRLADRAVLWKEKRENRHLPSLWEFFNIRLLTDKRKWTAPQRKMMRKAERLHGTRVSIAATVAIAALFSGWEINGHFQARSLVRRLMVADITEVPGIVHEMDGYRRWANPLLRQEDADAKEGSDKKLDLALALLAVDKGKVSELRNYLPFASPGQFPVIRGALLPDHDSVVEPLWTIALDPKRGARQRFQAACALAMYTPDDHRWNEINTIVAGRLVTLEASALVAWRGALRPAKAQLIRPLASIYSDTKQKEQSRTYATETLADYAADQPAALFDLLADAEQFQFPVLFDKVAGHKDKAVALAQEEISKKCASSASEEDKEHLAKRQANAAVALLRLGTPDKVWQLFKFNPDPRARSYLIHWLSQLGGDPRTITQRFAIEPDVTIRRSLVLTLGEFTERQLPPAERRPLIERLLAVYENEPDAGLHGAAEWLLRKWGQSKRLEAVIDKLHSNEQQLQARKSTDKRQWFINTQKQTFVIVHGGEFLMGSPKSESDRFANESQHRCRISRRFAISAFEVTKAQYRRFDGAVNGSRLVNDAQYAPIVRTDDSPQTAMTWYEAVHYCDWLSEQEKIPREQWCYDPKGGVYGPGMKAKDKFWELSGYRLPTEAESEFACRAGTVTSRYYGLSEKLFPQYAWYSEDGQNRAWPVGGLKPNDFGLFDTLGNAFEWCFDRYGPYPELKDKVVEDTPSTQPVDGGSRVLRGGAFANQAVYVRSAYRYDRLPVNRSYTCGFRPARTYP